MRNALIVISALLAVGLLSGCGEKSAERGTPTDPAKLPPGLASWQVELNKGKAQIDGVLATLDRLVATADTDPRPQFGQLGKDVAALDAQAAAVRSRGEAVRAQGNAYFAAWEEKLKTIGSGDIAKIAAARRDELNKEYEAVTGLAQKGREVYEPFVSDLKDINKILENDLNAEGIKAIAPQIEKLKGAAKAVKGHIDALTASLGKIAAIYSPGA